MRKNKRIGQAGEDKVAETLKTIPDSRLMRNQYIPCGHGHTIEVDALLLTRKGIFVIEIKNISGKIVGSYRLNEWTVHLKGKRGGKPSRYKIYNPIKQNARHLEAVARYLQVPPSTCTNLIVFTSRAELKKAPPNTNNFTITQETMLRSVMTRRLDGLSERFTDAELKSMENSGKARDTANVAGLAANSSVVGAVLYGHASACGLIIRAADDATKLSAATHGRIVYAIFNVTFLEHASYQTARAIFCGYRTIDGDTADEGVSDDHASQGTSAVITGNIDGNVIQSQVLDRCSIQSPEQAHANIFAIGIARNGETRNGTTRSIEGTLESGTRIFGFVTAACSADWLPAHIAQINVSCQLDNFTGIGVAGADISGQLLEVCSILNQIRRSLGSLTLKSRVVCRSGGVEAYGRRLVLTDHGIFGSQVRLDLGIIRNLRFRGFAGSARINLCRTAGV